MREGVGCQEGDACGFGRRDVPIEKGGCEMRIRGRGEKGQGGGRTCTNSNKCSTCAGVGPVVTAATSGVRLERTHAQQRDGAPGQRTHSNRVPFTGCLHCEHTTQPGGDAAEIEPRST